MRWASAGHDAAIIYEPAQDCFHESDAGDLPLGVMDDSQFSEFTFQPLKPGMIIAIGTDGVWETANDAGEQFGKDRLRTVLSANASLPAQQIIDALVQELAAFRGDCRQTDDGGSSDGRGPAG